MSNQDWSHIGEDIIDAVQHAVEDGDFANLSAALSNSAHNAMDMFEDALNGGSSGNYRRPANSYRESYERRYGQGSYDNRMGSSTRSYGGSDHYNSGTYDRNVVRQSVNTGRQAYAKSRQKAQAAGRTITRKKAPKAVSATMEPFMNHRDRYKSPGMLSIPGYLGAIGGAVFGGSFILSEIVLLFYLLFGFFDPEVLLGMGVIAPFAVAGVASLVGGLKRLALIKRFKKYVGLIGDRECCELDELAAMSGESKAQLLKDLKKMIGKGWFRQGHLDRQNKNVIVTNSTFRQYLQAQRNYDRQEMERRSQNVGRKYDGYGVNGKNMSQEASEAQTSTGPFVGGPAAHRTQTQNQAQTQTGQMAGENISQALPAEARTVIREGREYLRQIKASNEAIPGEEISNKISRLERIIDQIFERVEQHPELVDDLRRFMKYYLPTTCKLLKAYEELDRQAVQGPNILKSKADIEDTLDTINQAFENLLDGFFATSSMDIASDISVMQTLMSQEGLLEGDLKMPAESGREDNVNSSGEKDSEEPELYPDDDPIAQMLYGNANGDQNEVLRK